MPFASTDDAIIDVKLQIKALPPIGHTALADNEMNDHALLDSSPALCRTRTSHAEKAPCPS
jgi:hypothetical protein